MQIYTAFQNSFIIGVRDCIQHKGKFAGKELNQVLLYSDLLPVLITTNYYSKTLSNKVHKCNSGLNTLLNHLNWRSCQFQ